MTSTPCKIQILRKCHACLSLIFFSPAPCPARLGQLSGWFGPARRAGSLLGVPLPWRYKTSAPGPSGPGPGSLDAVRRDLNGHGRLEEGGMLGS